MYRDILLAVDLNHPAAEQRAVETVVEYARAFKARLHIMTVVPDFGMSMVGDFFPKSYEKKALAAANEKLHVYADEHVPADITRRHIVGHGVIYKEILKYSEVVKADLIVMSAHRPELEDYLLGPNAARVVRHANCSVLVVRPDPTLEAAPG
ncbi:MAG TPA: universal stress protein [Saliniramus sp.]|nr:universal stress protein [Saliniramus sp.]